MNTPIPTTPGPATPQTAPTLWGIGQSLLTGFFTAKAATALGATPDVAAVVGASVASAVTSAVHAWAQKLHLSPS